MPTGSFFNVKIKGLNSTTRVLEAVRLGIHDALGKDKIEKFLLKRALARFERRGRNQHAQKDPEGRPWPPIRQESMRGRHNRHPSQALVDTGTLRDSIKVLERKVDQHSLATGFGGIVIGIPKSSKAYRYGLKHNSGSGRIPKRQFLGVGNPDYKPIALMLRKSIVDRLKRVL